MDYWRCVWCVWCVRVAVHVIVRSCVAFLLDLHPHVLIIPKFTTQLRSGNRFGMSLKLITYPPPGQHHAMMEAVVALMLEVQGGFSCLKSVAMAICWSL